MTITTVGHRTDVGRRRRTNEDAVLVGRQIWAVADGMGGHAAGDIAADLVVSRLRRLDAEPVLHPTDVVAAVHRANADVLGYAEQHSEAEGLGSTVTGVASVMVGGEPHWAVFNVGDSRVYRHWRGALTRITVDHSETEELLASGRITASQARTHSSRHVITRSVGTPQPPLVDVRLLPVTPGERLLLCSDGLTSELTDRQIGAVLGSVPDPDDAAAALVAAVLRTPARDNVSVVIINVQGGIDEIDENTNPRGLLRGEPV